jgi:clan AA aspartic protease
MISGVVNAHDEATIHLRLHGPVGQEQVVEAVIDTGFNGFLTLSPALVERLGLLRIGRGRAILANGQEEFFDVYEVDVLWDSQWRTVEIDAAETGALIGMAMLHGYSLYVEAIVGGHVIIEPLLWTIV